jgi:VWFA-related protein
VSNLQVTARACVGAIATLVGLGCVGAHAATQPVLRVRSELVVLHVSVTDDARRPLADLPCDAFIVYEHDTPQEVSICQSGHEPLALGLVVDNSTSMRPYRELLATAGEASVRLGHPDNDVFVLQFNEHVRSGLQHKTFTRDPGDVAAAVRAMSARGMTALHDAIDHAIGWAGQSDRLKKAVILVSDGGDNASELTFDDALARALEANVTFFAVTIVDPLNRDADTDKLRRLARETGGLVFTLESPDDLHMAFEQIAQDLRSGYTLAYISSDDHTHGEYRGVRVRVRAPKGERVSIRTRAGYLVSGDTHESSR